MSMFELKLRSMLDIGKLLAECRVSGGRTESSDSPLKSNAALAFADGLQLPIYHFMFPLLFSPAQTPPRMTRNLTR